MHHGDDREEEEERSRNGFFCNHFYEKYQVLSFHFADPAAGRNKGWILREIQSALKELWQSM